MTPEVSILIPNFKTPLLTKLCLRSIRRHTDLTRVRVLVADNGSADESLEYLRTIPWISLTEKHPDLSVRGWITHAQSLDELMTQVDTEYVLSFHTDTIVMTDNWLDYLLAQINADTDIAAVGSWKLEHKSKFKKAGQSVETCFRRLLSPLTGRKVYTPDPYLRSHCALYRTELIRSGTRGFYDGMTAGKSIHQMLTAAGYRMVFLDGDDLQKYVRHFDHATVVMNPAIFKGRKSSRPRAAAKLHGEMDRPEFRAILSDDTLDL